MVRQSAETPCVSSYEQQNILSLLRLRLFLQFFGQERAPQNGGDPNRVTLFGESAGAFDVSLLMASSLVCFRELLVCPLLAF